MRGRVLLTGKMKLGETENIRYFFLFFYRKYSTFHVIILHDVSATVVCEVGPEQNV